MFFCFARGAAKLVRCFVLLVAAVIDAHAQSAAVLALQPKSFHDCVDRFLAIVHRFFFIPSSVYSVRRSNDFARAILLQLLFNVM